MTMRLLWWMCSLTHFVSLVSADSDCIGTWCDTCLPVTIHDAPGVGFDLTPLYGTAVVDYYNGTVVEVAKIRGNPEYLELMARLATSKPVLQSTRNFMHELPSCLVEYLFPSVWSPWRDWWRWLNVKLGRPIKADGVEIISDLLQELKIATEKAISQPLDRVAVTEPGFQALSPAMVNAALRVLGLRTWLRDSVYYPSRLVEGDAVYAANGYGLCINYLDRFQCADEFANSPAPTVFVVSYNHNLLYTSIMDYATSEAFPYVSSPEAQLVDYELGLDNLLENDQDQTVFWDRLRSQLQILPRESEYTITHILLAGESVTHPRFLASLRESMSELSLGPATAKIQLAIDPTFAAARGAALYARRRQEVPSDCYEKLECEEMRLRERFHTSTREELR
ncbi:unnamed protein product [Penicillium egyptiacum]|uniref:Carbohydrate kinase FGGY C-terminal domain-containing protein n=1 Tax=Penicillium egyptiacum TaxID=1303716 RepID=A0A9W4K2W9_9EURO|nr:unnamed protein product [Penicillium egyptiacum]